MKAPKAHRPKMPPQPPPMASPGTNGGIITAKGPLQQSANRPPKMPLSKVATDRGNFRIGK